MARDSADRVFEERRNFAPDGDKVATRVFELDFTDPNRHEVLVCRPDSMVCRQFRYDGQRVTGTMPMGLPPNGAGASVKTEDLGKKTVGELTLVGSREVTTIAAGAVGNQKAEPIVKEFWYSPELGINVITKRFDPRASAVQNFEVKDINLNEPDPKLFEPPADYRVMKMDAE